MASLDNNELNVLYMFVVNFDALAQANDFSNRKETWALIQYKDVVLPI